MGVANVAKDSLRSLAMDLGETSPKMRMTTVSTRVDTAGP